MSSEQNSPAEVTRKNVLVRPVSKCGVCGDLARHVHFGGLCCPSCKAFFRRVIQLKMTDKFDCSLNKNCSITMKTRRECPDCRFKKCLAIGMEPGWIMSEEERRTLMERRKEANVKLQLMKADNDEQLKNSNSDTTDSEIQINSNSDTLLENKEIEGPSVDENLENPNPPDDVHEESKIEVKEETEELLHDRTLCPNLQDMQILTQIMTHSFSRVKTPNDILEPENKSFGRICIYLFEVFSIFFSKISILNKISYEESVKLTKKAVSKCILIYGTHQCDPETFITPRKKIFNEKCSFPEINLSTVISSLRPTEIPKGIKAFFADYYQLLEDENVALCLMVISFLNTDDEDGHRASPLVIDLRDKYCKLLDDYMVWKYNTTPFQSMQTFWVTLYDVDKLANILLQVKLEVPLTETSKDPVTVTGGLKSECESNEEREAPLDALQATSVDYSPMPYHDHDYTVKLLNPEVNVYPKREVHEMDEDMHEINEDMHEINEDMHEINEDMDEINEDMREINEDIHDSRRPKYKKCHREFGHATFSSAVPQQIKYMNRRSFSRRPEPYMKGRSYILNDRRCRINHSTISPSYSCKNINIDINNLYKPMINSIQNPIAVSFINAELRTPFSRESMLSKPQIFINFDDQRFHTEFVSRFSPNINQSCGRRSANQHCSDFRCDCRSSSFQNHANYR